MQGHVKPVAIIHIVFGALGALVAIGFLILFGGMAGAASTQRDAGVALPVLGAIGGFLFLLIGALSVPSILAGWGLLNFREWGRVLTIILSVLNLLNFPLGTLIGGYSMWVLLNQVTLPLFRPAPGAPQA